jgi:hypothetical protein
LHFIFFKHGTHRKSGKPGVSDKYSLKISPENNMLNPRVGRAFISWEFFLGRVQYNIFMSVTKKRDRVQCGGPGTAACPLSTPGQPLSARINKNVQVF